MAKINKLQKSGQTIYPLTIPQAVIDSETGKTQKEVNDDVVEVAKTLKQVEDNASVKIENLVENGDFSDSSKWSIIGANGYTVDNGVATLIGSGGTNIYIRQWFNNIIIEDKYYIAGGVNINKANPSQFRFVLAGANPSPVINLPPIINNWYDVSYIATPPINNLYLMYQVNFTTPEDASGAILKARKPMLINLTQAFGAGNEPTKTEMDELIKLLPNGYFEGDLQNKYLHIWQLNLMRQNRNAIIALGGTII